MEVKQVKEEKEKLERNIAGMLALFSMQTGCEVEAIQIEYTRKCGNYPPAYRIGSTVTVRND